MDDDFSFEEMEREEPSNRTFNYVVIALVAIVILTIAGIALWMFVLSPRQQAARDSEATQTAAALTQAALAQVPTETFTPWPSNTPEPTSSPVLPPISPPTSTPTLEPVVQGTTETPTIVPTITPTPTSLPVTGFADEIGLPGLVTLAFLLVLIALAARQIRVSMTN